MQTKLIFTKFFAVGLVLKVRPCTTLFSSCDHLVLSHMHCVYICDQGDHEGNKLFSQCYGRLASARFLSLIGRNLIHVFEIKYKVVKNDFCFFQMNSE